MGSVPICAFLLYLHYLIPEGVPLGFGVGLGCPLAFRALFN